MTTLTLQVDNPSILEYIRELLSAVKGVRIVNTAKKQAKTQTVEQSDITEHVCQGLREVKMIRDGKLQPQTMEELLNEL